MSKILKKLSLGLLVIIIGIMTFVVCLNYAKQDEYIYRSKPLARDYAFEWKEPFEEIFLPVGSSSEINALHFHTQEPKGVVLFLHGQGKNLKYWGKRAPFFLRKGYDVMIIDYRGFGKSSREFKQEFLLEDANTAYRYLLDRFPEEQIVVYGQSLGTSIATHVTSQHKPKMLILEAPYYNMVMAASHLKPFLPIWLIELILKYPLKTNEWIQSVNVPIHIIHGNVDDMIPFAQAQKLYDEIKAHKKATFTTLFNWGHHDIDDNHQYQAKMAEIL